MYTWTEFSRVTPSPTYLVEGPMHSIVRAPGQPGTITTDSEDWRLLKLYIQVRFPPLFSSVYILYVLVTRFQTLRAACQ